MSIFRDIDDAREFLRKAGLFYDDNPGGKTELNQNDVWAWASAYGEPVPDDEMLELTRLFYDYGWCGVLYWVSERNEHMMSEFHHYSRMIEFVRAEEKIRQEFPDEAQRAYQKRQYTIGE